MRRLVIAGALALAAGTGTAAVAASAETPHAWLTAFKCQKPLDPGEREVSVTAVMLPLSHTKKMAMRFELLKRTKRYGHWVSLTGRGLKSRITPTNPTLGTRPGDRWIFVQRVYPLPAPAWYRFRVTFWWTGAHRHVIGRTVRQSGLCYQPERRADLKVTRIHVYAIAGSPGTDRYVGTIRNAGRTASGPFQVEFGDGSAPPQFLTVSQLLPHRQVRVSFTGPACSAATPATITADPTYPVDHAKAANNSTTTTCSSVSATSSLYGTGTSRTGR